MAAYYKKGILQDSMSPEAKSASSNNPRLRDSGGLCDGIIEAILLCLVLGTPLWVNQQLLSPFQLYKATVVQALTFLLAGTWVLRWTTGNTGSLGRSGKTTHTGSLLLLAAIGCYLVSNAISTSFSVSSAQSFFGAEEFADGTLTLFCYIVIAVSIAAKARDPVTCSRLISVLIVSTVPLTGFALLEWFGLDPLLHINSASKFQRVSSLVGNPIYLGGYLAAVMPFTALRLVESFQTSREKKMLLSASTGIFGTMLVLQGAIVLLTGSRGPALGLIAGCFIGGIVFAAWTRRRQMLIGLLCLITLAPLTVVGAKITGVNLTSLGHVPIIGRFATVFSSSDESREGRIIFWKTAVEISSGKTPYRYPSGHEDQWHHLRKVIGYGPDNLEHVIPQYLSTIDGDMSITNRFHSHFWDVWFSLGGIGMLSYLSILLLSLNLIFNRLGFLSSANRVKAYWWMVISGMILGALAATYVNICFIGHGILVGLLGGVVVFAAIRAFQKQAGHEGERPDFQSKLALTLLVALITHIVDVSVGFGVITTHLLWWVILGLTVTLGLTQQPQQSGGGRPIVSIAPAVAVMLCLVAFTVPVFVQVYTYDFVDTAVVLVRTIFRRAGGQEGKSILYTITLLVEYMAVASIFALEPAWFPRKWKPISAFWILTGSALLMGSAAVWLKAASIAAIGPIPAGSEGVEAFIATSRGQEAGSIGVLAIYVLLAVVFGFAITRASRTSKATWKTSWPRVAGIAGGVLAITTVIWFVNVTRLRADSAAGWAFALIQAKRVEGSIAVHQRAVELNPSPLRYRSTLADLLAKSAGTPANPAFEQRMEQAIAALNRGQNHNLLARDNHTLARLTLQWAALETNPAKRAELIGQCLKAYDQALIFEPGFEPAVYEKSLVYSLLLKNEHEAELLRRRADTLVPDSHASICMTYYCLANEHCLVPDFALSYAMRGLWFAAKTLKHAESAGAPSYRILMFAAEFQRQLGDKPGMQISLEAACSEADRPEKERDPDWFRDGWWAELILAKSYAEEGRLEDAKRRAERGLRFAPESMQASARSFLAKSIPRR